MQKLYKTYMFRWVLSKPVVWKAREGFYNLLCVQHFKDFNNPLLFIRYKRWHSVIAVCPLSSSSITFSSNILEMDHYWQHIFSECLWPEILQKNYNTAIFIIYLSPYIHLTTQYLVQCVFVCVLTIMYMCET